MEAIRSCKVQGSQVRLEMMAPNPLPQLQAAVEVAVYRIACEAIHNVVKHAQATVCVVCIEMSNSHLNLTVTDDGKGLPPKPDVGVGFHSMSERATELGGTLSIQSGELGGTRVAVQFPING